MQIIVAHITAIMLNQHRQKQSQLQHVHTHGTHQSEIRIRSIEYDAIIEREHDIMIKLLEATVSSLVEPAQDSSQVHRMLHILVVVGNIYNLFSKDTQSIFFRQHFPSVIQDIQQPLLVSRRRLVGIDVGSTGVAIRNWCCCCCTMSWLQFADEGLLVAIPGREKIARILKTKMLTPSIKFNHTLSSSNGEHVIHEPSDE